MNKTVIIGANGELGYSIASAAQARNDQVAGYDLTPAINENINWAAFGCIDLSSNESVIKAIHQANDIMGGIDVVINAAGIINNNSLLKTTDEDFSRVIDINLTGAFRLTKAVAEIMIKQQKGSILHLSSLHGLRGCIDRSAYAASKGGLGAFIQAVAAELGQHGINVNAIAPGPAGSGMGSAAKRGKNFFASIPMQREAYLSEVAAAAMYLSSPEAKYITGHILPLDGGASSSYFQTH